MLSSYNYAHIYPQEYNKIDIAYLIPHNLINFYMGFFPQRANHHNYEFDCIMMHKVDHTQINVTISLLILTLNQGQYLVVPPCAY